MTSTALFPHKYRLLGWILLIPGLLLGIAYLVHEFEWPLMNIEIPSIGSSDLLTSNQPKSEGTFHRRTENFTNEFIGLLILAGALLVGFSKEKVEDEFHVQLRFSALTWAVYVNAVLIVIAFVLLYGFGFLYVMMTNLFSILLLYIARYRWLFHRFKSLSDAQ